MQVLGRGVLHGVVLGHKLVAHLHAGKGWASLVGVSKGELRERVRAVREGDIQVCSKADGLQLLLQMASSDREEQPACCPLVACRWRSRSHQACRRRLTAWAGVSCDCCGICCAAAWSGTEAAMGARPCGGAGSQRSGRAETHHVKAAQTCDRLPPTPRLAPTCGPAVHQGLQKGWWGVGPGRPVRQRRTRRRAKEEPVAGCELPQCT